MREMLEIVTCEEWTRIVRCEIESLTKKTCFSVYHGIYKDFIAMRVLFHFRIKRESFATLIIQERSQFAYTKKNIQN